MPKFQLNRRAVIRGASGIAVALPWLEIMGTARTARAQATPGKRFVAVFTPGGTVRSKYTPTGTETAFTLSPILAPLEAVKNKVLILDGLDMKSAVGEQHQAGIIAFLTGTSQNNAPGAGGIPGQNSYGKGPSIDQVLAGKLSTGKRFPSIQLAVRWATGKSKGLISPINCMTFENNASFSPIPPRLDPVQMFNDFFGALTPGMGGTNDAAARITRKKSILDFVNKDFVALSSRLGAIDKQKIDQHLTKIRELEQSLTVPPIPPGAACKQPTKVDTSDYNPRTGLNSDDIGSIVDKSTDAAIPKVGKYMTDMLVMALACDMTGVASLQWTDTEAKHTFPWLGLSEHHHFYQHDGGGPMGACSPGSPDCYRAVECEKIHNWYVQQHLYLIQQMAAVDMGGHTLLDESVIFFGSELQQPPSHNKTNMPFLLAGNGGGLRTGRWLKYQSVSHNNLLVSIFNLFGDPRTTFGEARYVTGPLTNLV